MKSAYQYPPGTQRWRRYTDPGDVRGYRAPAGWDAEAMVIDEHPLTGNPLAQPQWWIRETRDSS
jgi:hypothetical protein